MPLAASKRHKSKTLAAFAGFSLIPAVGIACFRLTAWTMFSSELSSQDTNLTFLSRTLQAVVFILLLVIDRRVSYTERNLLVTTGIAAVGMTVGGIIFITAPSVTNLYIGCAVNGASSAIVMLGWGYYLCSIEPRKSAFSITLAFALFGIITWTLTVVSLPWIVLLMLFAPLASLGCLYLSVSQSNRKIEGDSPISKTALSVLPWGMVALLFICTAISILAKILAPMNTTLLASPYRLYWPIIFVCIFALFFFWIFVLKRDDQDRLWPVFVLVIFSGLLCYSSFSVTQPEFAAGFLRATQECLMLFCWIVTAKVVFTYSLPRVFTFGLSVLLFVEPPTLVADLLAMMFPNVGSAQNEPLAIVITAAMAFALIVLTIILISANSFVKSRSEEKAPKGDPVVDPLLDALEEIIEEYKLTKRESEVALYLARGYTLPQTAEMLCVSLDTIRSHTKRLYRKMNIHKKQELIAILEHKNPLLRSPIDPTTQNI